MDILKHLSDNDYKDIIVSFPKNKSWLAYLNYFMEIKSNHDIIPLIVSSVPKSGPGNKCFVIYDGMLRGWLEIYRLTETEDNEICVELVPYFTSITNVPMSEIEDFKYFLDNSNTQ